MARGVKGIATSIPLSVAVRRAAEARAAACGLSVERVLVELVENGLAAERCRHTPRPNGDGQGDEDADP